MATPSALAAGHSSTTKFACVRCAERKIKCDRSHPCSICLKDSVECVARTPQPPKRRKRVTEDASDQYGSSRKLQREQGTSAFQPHDKSKDATWSGRDSAVVQAMPSVQQVSHEEPENRRNLSNIRVIHDRGRSMIVENSLWSRVAEEFQDPEDTLADCTISLDGESDSEDDCYLGLVNHQNRDLKSSHPPRQSMHHLWRIFAENIDPLTKIVHVPTLRPAFERSADDIDSIPRAFEPLLFAIYGAAIMSLSDDECQHRFQKPRLPLLRRYLKATGAALSRAKFMESTNTVVLQALVLHLLTMQSVYKPRAVWSLTGVAVRIAQAMGLDRDGSALGLPPFEAEIRRRIWWMLKTHDSRTAELCGIQKFKGANPTSDSTMRALNINDDQLYPGMSSLPAEPKAMADSSFVALRYEFADLAARSATEMHQRGQSPSGWEQQLASRQESFGTDKFFDNLEEHIEMKYLRYCDPSEPLHLLTMLMARAAINTIRFMTHHPRRWSDLSTTPSSERRSVWDISIKLLEQHNMFHSNPQLQRFTWQAPFVIQWHAFIHVLDTLRADPLSVHAKKAWRLVGRMFGTTPDLGFDTKKPICVAISSLCLKAYDAYETALRGRTQELPSTPTFIEQLRQQQRQVEARRRAGSASSVRVKEHLSSLGTRSPEMASNPHHNANQSADVQHGQRAASMSAQDPPPVNNNVAEEDPFWFVNVFEDYQLPKVNDVVDMDFGTLEEDLFKGVTWEQWDAWIAGSDTLAP